MYIIEKNVPIVENRTSINSGILSVFRNMQISDSVVMEKKRRQYAHVCASKIGIKVKTANEGLDKIRVWRIA